MHNKSSPGSFLPLPTKTLLFRIKEYAQCLCGCLLFTVAIAMLTTGRARAQNSAGRPLVDAITVGAGINFYQGDLDQNVNNNPIKFLGLTNLNLTVKGERRFGEFGAGVMLTYDRFTGRSSNVDFANNAVGLNLTASYDLPVLPSDLVRVFVGGGPMLLVPNYYRFSESSFRENDKRGTRFVGVAMVGLIIQNRIHIGFRATSTDYLDGSADARTSNDYLSFVNLGYRFTLP